MSTPPALPSPIASSMVKETRILLSIAGVFICGLGALALCGGGMAVSMAASLPMFRAQLFENTTVGPPEEQVVLDAISAIWSWTEPLILPLIATSVLSALTSAAALIWLGIGTIQGRRWARKLLLAAGWAWCGMIALQLIAFLAMIPGMADWLETASGLGGTSSASPAGIAMGLVIQVIMNVVVYASSATPGIALIVVFGLRNVRLTCEQLDPGPNWTDRIPVQVLPLWLLQVGWLLQAVSLLPLLPAFTQLATDLGWETPGYVIPASLAATAYLGLCIGLMARMNPLSWWLAFAGSLAAITATCILHLRTDFVGCFQIALSHLPIPEADRAQLQKEVPPELLASLAGFLRDYWVVVAVTGAAYLGVLIWLKQYFRPADADQPSP